MGYDNEQKAYLKEVFDLYHKKENNLDLITTTEFKSAYNYLTGKNILDEQMTNLKNDLIQLGAKLNEKNALCFDFDIFVQILETLQRENDDEILEEIYKNYFDTTNSGFVGKYFNL
jgi:hypothetical protein